MTGETSCACPTCKGRGIIETGAMENGPGGIGFESLPCADCGGTGEIFPDSHEAFKYDHGTSVQIDGEMRVVFFDYEGDDIFVWWLPGDECTNGEHLTEPQRQQVHEQLCDWWDDWTAPRSEDYL
jgi:hypothetical protein